MAQGSPELIAPVNGPLARSIDDLALFCELIVRDGTKHDSEAIPLPWTPVTLTTKLKIGYFIDTELFRATPPVRRAMNQTLRALEAAGHELVPFPVTDGSEILTLATQIFGAFSENIHAVLASTGEPLIEGLKWMVNSLPTASAADMWDYFIRRQQIRKRYLARMLDLDGLVCPTIGIPTVPHHRSGDAIPACVYTIMFNLLDYSAGVVPVTSTTESDVVPPDFVPAEGIEASIYNVYDPVVFKGAPVGIQVVGKRLQEEKVLAMMKVVDAAVKAAAN